MVCDEQHTTARGQIHGRQRDRLEMRIVVMPHLVKLRKVRVVIVHERVALAKENVPMAFETGILDPKAPPDTSTFLKPPSRKATDA